MYTLLADAVIVIHLLFIAFVVAGGLVVLYRPKVAFLHLPAAFWGAFIDFVDRYLIPVIYPAGLTNQIQNILGAFVVAINLVFYFFAIRRHLFGKQNA